MIGIFDSGLGGLTITKALVAALPEQNFTYLADRANAPYGNQPTEQVLEHTLKGVDILFRQGCQLVILGCNTASAIAGAHIQQVWLPATWPNRNVLGIIAPTVEAATQTPWHVKTPVYPQKYNKDRIAVFATAQTINSQVYETEIAKRCPQATLFEQACPELAGAIDAMAPTQELERLVQTYVDELLAKTNGQAPHWAILGCTHFPLVADLFQAALPPQTRLLDQPGSVADSLRDYLQRHRYYKNEIPGKGNLRLFTTADPVQTSKGASLFLGQGQEFELV